MDTEKTKLNKEPLKSTSRSRLRSFRLFSRENVLAVLLCLLAIFLVIIASDSAPQWIYQGF